MPVGTNDRVRAAIRGELQKRGVSFGVRTASNPEFLKEGFAVGDFMKPDRIVVGVDDPVSIETLRKMYASFNRNRDRLIVMDVRSAEFTKYAANCMLAVHISFMNELANRCKSRPRRTDRISATRTGFLVGQVDRRDY